MEGKFERKKVQEKLDIKIHTKILNIETFILKILFGNSNLCTCVYKENLTIVNERTWL